MIFFLLSTQNVLWSPFRGKYPFVKNSMNASLDNSNLYQNVKIPFLVLNNHRIFHGTGLGKSNSLLSYILCQFVINLNRLSQCSGQLMKTKGWTIYNSVILNIVIMYHWLIIMLRDLVFKNRANFSNVAVKYFENVEEKL